MSLVQYIDLVVPCAYAMPFWIALQYATGSLAPGSRKNEFLLTAARVCCMDDRKRLALQLNRCYYPDDWIDTAAGSREYRILVRSLSRCEWMKKL